MRLFLPFILANNASNSNIGSKTIHLLHTVFCNCVRFATMSSKPVTTHIKNT